MSQEFNDYVQEYIKSFDKQYVKVAACRSAPPEEIKWFYSRKVTEQIKAANNYCRGCPIAEDCLKVAFLNHENFGVWGGAIDTTRSDMVKKLRSVFHLKSSLVWTPELWNQMLVFIDDLVRSPFIPFDYLNSKRKTKRPNPIYFSEEEKG